MNFKIEKAVRQAREFFSVEKYPSNFFELIDRNDNYIEEYGMFLFKEDLHKLSGFIGYTEDNRVAICINYNRPIGHQNFTLAHEVGHWFLHRGQSISDTHESTNIWVGNTIETEANEFAKELLYPEELATEDYLMIVNNGLLDQLKRKELGEQINLLCHKYCLSFEMVLRRILYKAYRAHEYNMIKKQIEKAIGSNISLYFDEDFYRPNNDNPLYQRYMKPYEELSKNIHKLEEAKEIGVATAESILCKYDL